ncbi:hypothetical protein [Anaeromyxobacter paludicola]|uniref:hypothetical protein n=1 Tax=Anaeromyxobacter paludicola TaxID=2918171 RepID=UPI0020C0CD5F|nr:hypothetical protein [Anaeromyxobacter paludicola]
MLFKRLMAVACRWAEAESDEEYEAALQEGEQVIGDWALAMGWKPLSQVAEPEARPRLALGEPVETFGFARMRSGGASTVVHVWPVNGQKEEAECRSLLESSRPKMS